MAAPGFNAKFSPWKSKEIVGFQKREEDARIPGGPKKNCSRRIHGTATVRKHLFPNGKLPVPKRLCLRHFSAHLTGGFPKKRGTHR